MNTQIIKTSEEWELWVADMLTWNEGFDPPAPRNYPCYLLWYRESILVVHVVLDAVDLRVLSRQLEISGESIA